MSCGYKVCRFNCSEPLRNCEVNTVCMVPVTVLGVVRLYESYLLRRGGQSVQMCRIKLPHTSANLLAPLHLGCILEVVQCS